ncbi:DUF72 domain-containing protein [Pseudomonas typographi]|uniref:DUF72 domain-containing protein n=1 Tax=Pseudomonas typographi TaxID=2715964 RepID=UPI00168649C8|nr:DUF72 domain-containing protein [Pseudomonas typographi]MBD1554176.1 DUF72 domain-containing protein [Pseudomonas typographi]
MSKVHVGISGWRYAPWRGVFYPKGLAQKHELRYAARAVSAIEINGSFYALQTPERYAQWYADTPGGFTFTVKAPRYITHTRRLKDIETPLANFFASGVFALKEKLGAFLWQFPPNFQFDPERFEAFLARLPRRGDQALAIARQCEARMHAVGWDAIAPRQVLRHAVEVRHESFACAEFAEMLRRYGVAWVVADTAGKWPYAEDLTADFVYMRLHGDAKLYESGYSQAALDRWQQRIECWAAGRQVPGARQLSPRQPRPRKARTVFCFFDNDVKVHAPADARALAAALGIGKPLPDPKAL